MSPVTVPPLQDDKIRTVVPDTVTEPVPKEEPKTHKKHRSEATNTPHIEVSYIIEVPCIKVYDINSYFRLSIRVPMTIRRGKSRWPEIKTRGRKRERRKRRKRRERKPTPRRLLHRMFVLSFDTMLLVEPLDNSWA
jgi:hypothetical protein